MRISIFIARFRSHLSWSIICIDGLRIGLKRQVNNVLFISLILGFKTENE